MPKRNWFHNSEEILKSGTSSALLPMVVMEHTQLNEERMFEADSISVKMFEAGCRTGQQLMIYKCLKLIAFQ